jgi:hypothetical protein
MKKLPSLCLFFFFVTGLGFADHKRRVEDHVLVSESLPAIRIQVDPAFQFVGSFPFRIQNIAQGERYVFIDGTSDQVRRMFIAQFESILPASSEIYRYSFENAELIGGYRFRHNTFAFNVQEAIKENPTGESMLTQQFLENKEYKTPDEWMSSRFLTLGDESRKSELILFYLEPVASTGHRLAEFYNGEEPTRIWQNISKDLTARSRSAFRIQSRK